VVREVQENEVAHDALGMGFILMEVGPDEPLAGPEDAPMEDHLIVQDGLDFDAWLGPNIGQARNADNDASMCTICFEAEGNLAYIPCGHMGICPICARNNARLRGVECPYCRGQSLCLMRIHNMRHNE
jgi:hypothetical protein